MSNPVRRYWVPTSWLKTLGWHPDDTEIVQAWEYDAASAREAALREELADALAGAKAAMAGKDELRHERDNLQQRLADAERRNSVMAALLEEHQWEWQPYDEHGHRDGGYYCLSCNESKSGGHAENCAIDAALNKPEEAKP